MKIRYVNFKKEFPAVASGRCAFKKWFYFNRMWSGKIINIGIKHHQITIDLRGDLFYELTGKHRV